MNRLMVTRLVVTLCLTLGLAAWAQDVPDASSVPDASAGEGGPDQTSEENDPNPACLDSRSCDMGTSCINGHCVPVKTRSIGCGAMPLAPMAFAAMLLAIKRRTYRA